MNTQKPARCTHLVTYRSAVTGNVIWSGCPSKAHADKEAKALTREGARNVRVIPYGATA